MKYFVGTMGLILLVFLGILMFQDRYYFYSPDVWMQKLAAVYEYAGDDLFGTLYALNISIVFTVIGLVLAMVTFLLSKNKITFMAYLANVLEYDPVRSAFSLLILSFLVTLSSAYFPYTLLVDVWLKISMVFPVSFAIVVTRNLTRIESREFLRLTMYGLAKTGGARSQAFFRDVFLPTFEDRVYEELDKLLVHATKQREISNTKLYDFHSSCLASIEESGR